MFSLPVIWLPVDQSARTTISGAMCVVLATSTCVADVLKKAIIAEIGLIS